LSRGIAARVVGSLRVNLLNTSLTIRGPDGTELSVLTSAAELSDVLEDLLDIRLPVAIDDIWTKLPAEAAPHWP
jgi:hypothetical protein